MKEEIFSLATVVGKSLQVDMEKKNQTRPRYATVKVEVDMLGDFSKRIKIRVRKSGVKIRVRRWRRLQRGKGRYRAIEQIKKS